MLTEHKKKAPSPFAQAEPGAKPAPQHVPSSTGAVQAQGAASQGDEAGLSALFQGYADGAARLADHPAAWSGSEITAAGGALAKKLGEGPPRPDPQVAKDKAQKQSDEKNAKLDEESAQLADPKGYAKDKAAAIAHQRALRVMGGKLEVVKKGEKPKAQNQVSQAEFDELVKLYGDIDLGKSDLQIDKSVKDPQLFKSYAMEDLARLMQTDSGRRLVAQLADNKGGPAGGGEHKQTIIGALENTPKTEIDKPSANDYANTKKTANGVGVDALVKYGAGQSYNVAPGTDWGDARSDVVLYHELVHALHDTHGDTPIETEQHPVGEQDKRVEAKEYQATGLGEYADAAKNPFQENLYRKERKEVSAAGQINGSIEALSDAKMPPRPSYNPPKETKGK